jgi:hypothetical protein
MREPSAARTTIDFGREDFMVEADSLMEAIAALEDPVWGSYALLGGATNSSESDRIHVAYGPDPGPGTDHAAKLIQSTVLGAMGTGLTIAGGLATLGPTVASITDGAVPLDLSPRGAAGLVGEVEQRSPTLLGRKAPRYHLFVSLNGDSYRYPGWDHLRITVPGGSTVRNLFPLLVEKWSATRSHCIVSSEAITKVNAERIRTPGNVRKEGYGQEKRGGEIRRRDAVLAARTRVLENQELARQGRNPRSERFKTNLKRMIGF